METTLALPIKQPSPLTLSKHQSQSGSLAYGKISDNDHNSANKFDLYSTDNKIRVIARFRPKNKREVRWAKENHMIDSVPLFISAQQVRLEPSPFSSGGSRASIDFNTLHSSNSSRSIHKRDTSRHFTSTLDHVLPQECTQRQVFYLCGLPMITACLDGYNATIFAYGQSGSGKTYTMMGPETDVQSADDFGLVPRCIIYLFQKLDENLSQNGGKLQDYIVNMELLQIYKSQLLDLVNPENKKKLVIKTNFTTDCVFVQNLKSVQVQTVEEAFKLLTLAQENRIVAGHSLNEVSSRSHMLIMMTVIQRSVDGTLKTSKLNFGDLAGSEDLTKALGRNPDRERRKEAIAINQSLSALTTAVSYLSRGQKPGFRDSPLTHILKDSLGGNSKSCMLVTVSPHVYNRAETIRTLRFASTAKKVKNKAKINEAMSMMTCKKRIKELERENGKLRQELIVSNKKNAKMLKKEKERKMHDMSSSVIMYDDGGDAAINESDEKMLEQKVIDIKMLSSESDEIIEMDDEWGSDTEGDDMDHDLENNIKLGLNNSSEEDEESNFELNEYVNQLNEYRDKLDREFEENLKLQGKIDEKNLEIEACNNRIGELVDELNSNEQDLYDAKTKIRQLQFQLTQYQCSYPLFKPETVGPGTPASGHYDDYDIVQEPMTPLVPTHHVRNDTLIQQSGLLENLLTLHRRMENKMKETECALNEIRRVTGSGSELTVVAQANSPMVYESADEKLDEWDLDVSTRGDSAKITPKHRQQTNGKTSSKQMRKHLKSLSKNEKKLKSDLVGQLKQEAKAKNAWCQCFWQKPPIKEDVGTTTSKLIEEYLKMQLRKDLVKDKYQKKKEKDRLKALKKRIK
eukprot:319136_1